MATGERLKLAREAQGLTLEELAEATLLTPKSLTEYESGAQEPEPEQLWDLAQALFMDLGFFLRTLPVVDILPANPDGLASLPEAERQQVIAQARIWIERYFDIESFFPVEEIPLFTLPEGFPLTVTSAKEAADAGEELRVSWGLGHLPIASLADMLEDAGIKVGLIEGAGTFDAAGFVTSDDLQIPFVVARRGSFGDAQRFGIARELGMLVLEGVNTQLASHFAGAFLAPAAALRYEMGLGRTNLELYELQLLKQKYGISMRRLVTRAASLRIISKDEMQRWLDAFRKASWQQEEPGFEYPAEQPRRMLRLALRLQAEGEIEPGRAAELLGVPEEDWLALVNFDEVEEEEAVAE